MKDTSFETYIYEGGAVNVFGFFLWVGMTIFGIVLGCRAIGLVLYTLKRGTEEIKFWIDGYFYRRHLPK